MFSLKGNEFFIRLGTIFFLFFFENGFQVGFEQYPPTIDVFLDMQTLHIRGFETSSWMFQQLSFLCVCNHIGFSFRDICKKWLLCMLKFEHSAKIRYKLII